MISAHAIAIEIMVGPPGWLGSSTAWKAFLDCAQQIETADGFRYYAMSVDSLTISCFVARNEAGYEYNWHSVQRPIGFDLCGHFSAIKLRHYKIQEDQIRPEAACRFHRTRCVIFFTDDVLAGFLQNQTRAVTKTRIIVHD